MKQYYIVALCGSLLFSACGGDFSDATYDGLLPMTLIYSNQYIRNTDGNNVYLNTDDGSIAFGGAEFEKADFFSCGLAYIADARKDAPRRGFIDKNNRLVIECKREDWKSISGFSEDLAIGRTYESEYVVINTKGEKVFSLSSDEWTPLTLYKDGCSVWVKQDGVWAVIDKKGNIRTFSEYSPVYNCYPSHGLICVCEGKNAFFPKYGAMDIKSGKLIIPCNYKEPFMFDRNGYAAVVDPETRKYGLIDRKGQYTIQPDCESIETDGPDLYKCANYNTYDDSIYYSWQNHKGKTIVFGGPEFGRSAYFFAGSPYFVKVDYNKSDKNYRFLLYSRNLFNGYDLSAIAKGENYKRFVVYPPALKNGNSIGNYLAGRNDHRCLLVNNDFEPIGNHEFHARPNAVWDQLEEMKRLQLFYTHGIPYVSDKI